MPKLTTQDIDTAFEALRPAFHEFMNKMDAANDRHALGDAAATEEDVLEGWEARDKFDASVDDSIVMLLKVLDPTYTEDPLFGAEVDA